MTAWRKSRHAKRHKVTAFNGPPASVTVVILCYNYGHYLVEAANSALSQVGVAVNVVIVDDKSTDGSIAVAHAIAARNHQVVTVIENEQNLGLVGAFNVGLAAATGEFVVRIDADDLLTPGSLKRAVDVGRAHPLVGLIYGRPIHFRGIKRPAARTRPSAWTVWSGQQWLEDRCREGHNVITSPEVMMRRSVVEEVGPIQPLKHTNDMEMWCRMAAFSDVAYIHGADQAWHRDHDQSMSMEVSEILEIEERAQAFDVLFGGIAAQRVDARRLHRHARNALANEALDAAIHAYDCGRGDSELVNEYVEFARRMPVTTSDLPSWRRLERRRKLGSEKAGLPIRSIAPRVLRRVNNSLKWSRWRYTGVF